MENMGIRDQKIIETSCVSVKPESGCCNDSLNNFTPIVNAEGCSFEACNALDNNGSDELIDVRICDICGDVGREHLLALCSKCSDGAEHIYCMRIKIDKVPEGDWICEDCMLMQEPKKRLTSQLERSDSAPSPSYLKDVTKGLPTVYSAVWHVSEANTKDHKKSFCSSALRPASDMELKSAAKKRALEKSIQPVKSSRFGKKKPLPVVSSLKLTGKRKDGGSLASLLGNQSAMEESTSPSSGHRSPKPGSDIELRTPQKRIILQKNCQPLNSPSSRGKSLLTRVSSLKKMDKGKIPRFQGSSFSIESGQKELEQAGSPSGHKSPKREPQCRLIRSWSVSGERLQLAPVSSHRTMDKGEGAYCKASFIDTHSHIKKLEQESTSSDYRTPKPQLQYQMLKSSSFAGKKLQLTQVASPKMMDKRKDLSCRVPSVDIKSTRKAVAQASPLAGRGSSKPEFQCHADSNTVQQSHDDIKLKKHPAKRLFKSMSFGGVSSVSAAVLSHASSGKGLINGSEGKSSRKRGDQHGLSPTGFDAVVGNASSTKMVSEVIKRPHSSNSDVKNEKSIQVNGNPVFDALVSIACDGQSNENRSAGESALKAESGCPSKEMDGHIIANKVQAVDLCPMKGSPELSPLDVVSPKIAAVPESEATWKGTFQLEESGKLPSYYSGIQAHLSTYASPNVLELVPKFHPDLLLNEVPRVDTWPVQFQNNYPTEQDIALYFFAEDSLSYARSYQTLLEGMIRDDLALEANFNGVQLLVFPSNLLPVQSQRWNGLLFLWGVFRPRKVNSCGLHISSLNAATFSQGLCTHVTHLCPSGAGSFSTSQSSDNFIKGPGSVDPTAFQSLFLRKSTEQGFDLEVSSIEVGAEGPEDQLGCKDGSIAFGNDQSKKEACHDSILRSNDFQKGDGPCGHSDLKFHSFPFPQTDAQNAVSTTKPMEEEKKVDIFSRSSFSIDSGPSGSSDGAGGAKSDEGQVEQFRHVSNYKALNLDLCLSPMVEVEGGQVDLDLVLGSPSTSNYKFKHFAKDISSDRENVSLFLSLGMPCSNA